MPATEKPPAIPPELMCRLQRAADEAARGVRDRESMRRAAEEMDQTREQIRRRIGIVDFAVPTIRALRGDGE